MKFIPSKKLYGSGLEIADLARYLSRNLNLIKHGITKAQLGSVLFFVMDEPIPPNIGTMSCTCIVSTQGNKSVISASSGNSCLSTDFEVDFDSQFQLLELAINDREFKEDPPHIGQLDSTDLNLAFLSAQQYFLSNQKEG